MMRDRAQDYADKLARLAEVGRARGLDTLVLRDPATLAWLLEARVHVPQTLDSACLDVVVDATAPRVTIVTNAIEAPRLLDTELAGLDVDWRVLPWWESRDAALPSGAAIGSDRAAGQTADVAADVAATRRVLTARQQELLRTVCADAAQAATQVALTIEPAARELDVAARFAAAIIERGMDPIVLLIGGDQRIGPHRHPLPTAAPVGERAMLVACARRHGLVASITRIVAFGQGNPAWPGSAAERIADPADYPRLLEVEAAFLDASQPGARIGDVVATGVAAYGACGFDQEEWHRHHQGGFSGVQPREFPAHQGSDAVLVPGCVVAWNPSGAGWKVEDTAIVGASGPELLVHDPDWPTVRAGGRARPGILQR